jgi:hypothetical protein
MTSRAVFSGLDASDHINLWVTDGTVAGTSELTPAGAYYYGLLDLGNGNSPDFTALGGRILFLGVDTSGRYTLWVTDGTSAWTSELSVDFSGLPDFTVIGSKALLGNGGDLWVTDGTAAGTTDLTAAFPTGPNLSDLTVLGDKALFSGNDPSGRTNIYGEPILTLWVTDGTAAGTSGFANDSDPIDITSIGGRAVFEGSGPSGLGLFVTDGTSAGTSELTVAGASTNGLFSGVYGQPNYTGGPDFTALGSRALFAGDDASDRWGLWVTDGTSAGTSELTVAGAYSDGLFAGIVPQFIALGNKVLFLGVDSTRHSNLWITDGTSAGTHELAVAGGVNVYSFCVVGNKVLFEGVDQYGQNGLWITDGTSAGTSEVAVPGAWSGGGGLSPNDITAFPPPPAPVTIATNGVTSLVQVGSQYELEAVSSGTGPLLKYGGSTVTVGEFPGWTPVGAEKTATGYEVAWSLGANEYSVWSTDSNGAYTGAVTGVLSGASYALQHLEPSFGEDLNGDGTIGPTFTKPPATSDFNKDGFSDILWQNMDGQASIWDMNGYTLVGGGAVSPNPGPNWHAVGTGDFNHDGHSDILWQNVSGQASIWEMNGNTLIGGGAVSPNPGPAWKRSEPAISPATAFPTTSCGRTRMGRPRSGK